MKKISIIIPVYNAEKSIEKCINSIQKQSYKNIEIICIDDGSSDNSLLILRGLSQKDNRIKIISQANSGPFLARKAGILSATGDYIMFVDADDKLSNKNAASIIVERFNEKSVELLQFGFYSYHGRFIRKKHINQVLGLITKEDLKNLYYKDYLSSESSGALGVSLWNKAYLTHILTESVSNLDTKIKFGEDLLLLLK